MKLIRGIKAKVPRAMALVHAGRSEVAVAWLDRLHAEVEQFVKDTKATDPAELLAALATIVNDAASALNECSLDPTVTVNPVTLKRCMPIMAQAAEKAITKAIGLVRDDEYFAGVKLASLVKIWTNTLLHRLGDIDNKATILQVTTVLDRTFRLVKANFDDKRVFKPAVVTSDTNVDQVKGFMEACDADLQAANLFRTIVCCLYISGTDNKDEARRFFDDLGGSTLHPELYDYDFYASFTNIVNTGVENKGQRGSTVKDSMYAITDLLNSRPHFDAFSTLGHTRKEESVDDLIQQLSSRSKTSSSSSSKR